MPDTQDLSDKAIAVFAFAAYHQLTSGQPVTSVIREDKNGHKADDAAIDELTGKDLVEITGNDITFSESGLRVLSTAIDGLKSAARSA